MSGVRTICKDLKMPKDFPVRPFEAIYSRVTALKEDHQDSWSEFASAWRAVAYRFLSCSEHDKQFTKSIQRVGNAPQQPERYIQERELFGFFTTGLATIETFSYGLFTIGSMLYPQHFPMGKPGLITPKKLYRVGGSKWT